MGILERSLRALTSDQSATFYVQVESHRAKFSDIAGITDARRVRNALAHGESVSGARVEEARSILEQALTEVLPYCPERIRLAMREPPGASMKPAACAPMAAKPLVSVRSADAANTSLEQIGKVQNVCPECGHQFKGKGFDGIDAHWRARHEAVMPYRDAWPLVKSGSYPKRPGRSLAVHLASWARRRSHHFSRLRRFRVSARIKQVKLTNAV
jgi:hypothetical protein